MWLRKLHVRNLRRLRDFTLDLRRPDGSAQMWTVLIGRNGTGKSSLLQAIALAAAGAYYANDLAKDVRESMPDKRLEEKSRGRARPVNVEITADFGFGPIAARRPSTHPTRSKPSLARLVGPAPAEWLRSNVVIQPGKHVDGWSWYTDSDRSTRSEQPQDLERGDPLTIARHDDLHPWFVAGYGVQRDLPETALVIDRPQLPAIDRLRPLFGPQKLIGPNFQALFGSQELSVSYAKLLKDVLLRTEKVVPGIVGLELRGRGGVTKPSQLTEDHRFVQRVGKHDLKLPARWLSHGYQSSLSWLSDLVGQVVLEAQGSVPPEKIEGLVLIDEIDLYLHPEWQVSLVGALKETLPKLQFIVTTHSPIFLSAFRPEEVVRLEFDEEGSVVRAAPDEDPRLMTGSELYERFFHIDQLYPAHLGETLDLYTRLASNPFRGTEDETTMRSLAKKLADEGIKPARPPTPRRRPKAG